MEVSFVSDNIFSLSNCDLDKNITDIKCGETITHEFLKSENIDTKVKEVYSKYLNNYY